MRHGSIRAGLAERSRLMAEAAALLSEGAEQAAALIHETLLAGGTLFFCGNGGSAADAQHLAAEYVVRLNTDRRALPAIALTTDTSVFTAAANDLGFDQVFSRQLEALGRRGDLLILHSTSGESENLLRVAGTARDLGVRTVALVARGGGRLRELVDLAIVVPTDRVTMAQEIQLALGHEICEEVERVFGASSLDDVAGRTGTEGDRGEW
jgi:D-sedoheptulose 7-phosphate isomerase